VGDGGNAKGGTVVVARRVKALAGGADERKGATVRGSDVREGRDRSNEKREGRGSW
jgi:hypothetical protein